MNKAWEHALDDTIKELKAGENMQRALFFSGASLICPFCGCDKVNVTSKVYGVHGWCPVCGGYEIEVHESRERPQAEILVTHVQDRDIELVINWGQ